jgi:beta-lactamase superfamily II metal-dependent hydrolase
MSNRLLARLLPLLLAPLAAPLAYPQQLQIHTIDVGQGASELIIGPDGTTLLIDAGTYSAGQSKVVPYLQSVLGASYLDYVVASHDDSDHYGGLEYLLSNGYSAGTIYNCCGAGSFGEGVQIPLGMVINLGNGATATCVLRDASYIDGTTGSVSDNNNSVCLLIRYGAFDYITAGDLESNEDHLASMLVSYPPGNPFLDPSVGVDVIHVNHHGSNSSSLATYVNNLKHELAVINGGTNYGHPRWTAVDRLKGRSTYSDGSGATGVTWAGCNSVFRTTYDAEEDGRAPEWDCPTLGNMVVSYTLGSPNYYMNGTTYPVDESVATPTPTPEGYRTPSPTPTVSATPTLTPTPPGYKTPTPTPSSSPSPTVTPTVTPTPEGYKTPIPTPGYCAASGGCDEYISRVQFAGIDNSSACSGYAYYPAVTTVVMFGSSYGITVTNPKPYTGDACDTWVDWDQDGDFSGPGENTTLASGPEVFTGTISVPPDATAGDSRMRIRIRYYASVSPCGAFNYGEVEDYPIRVSAAPPTPPPTPSTTPSPFPSPTPTCGPSIAPRSIVIQSDDYDGDGADDIGIFRPSAGLWSIKDITRLNFGNSTDQPGPGDYTGDGTAEIAIYRSSTGLWSISGLTRAYFGGVEDRAAAADYNGDGSCDLAIFRENGGMWSIRNLSRFYFGATGDWAIPGDWNGDGIDEAALYRPSSGQWMIRNLSRFYLGVSTDWPIPSDYRGDGLWVAGIFRPCSGTWAIRDITRVFFGNCFDYPVPADYSGEGTTDIGIFRDSAGMWSLRNITRVYFGATGDIPVTR